MVAAVVVNSKRVGAMGRGEMQEVYFMGHRWVIAVL